MTHSTDIQKHMAIALKEIGTIQPWWSEADQLYIFEHPAYPFLDYAAATPALTEAGFLKVLEAYIQDRLSGNIAPALEQITTGHGGRRSGAGRPKGTVKGATKQVRVPVDIADWLRADPDHLIQVRHLMAGTQRKQA